MSELPTVVSGLVVRPGDTLIIGMKGFVTDADFDIMSKRIAERMPGLKVAFIDNVEVLAAYRPDAAPPAETAG